MFAKMFAFKSQLYFKLLRAYIKFGCFAIVFVRQQTNILFINLCYFIADFTLNNMKGSLYKKMLTILYIVTTNSCYDM